MMQERREPIEQVSLNHMLAVSQEVARGNSTKGPSMLRWPGRRPSILVRFFLALLASESPDEAYMAARGVKKILGKIRSKASNQKIYDPFAGSGTIPIEAARLGFYAIGQDVNPYAVGVAEVQATLCTGECRIISSCLWKSLSRSWERMKKYWCYRDTCILHLLLARCPPCRAPVWVSSKRGKKGPRQVLVLREDLSLEWTSPDGKLGSREPSLVLPSWLPRVHEDYVAYAVEILVEGSRRWVSLAHDDDLRLWVEKTAAEAKSIVENLPEVPIPLMEETRRLYRRGVLDARKLYSWRQLSSFASFIEESDGCRNTSLLLAANATPTNSLMAIYYQPLAKVNPGLVVKSYWLPRNPVVLNPYAHRGLPAPPSASAQPIGRGTLVSLVKRYTSSCGRGDCKVPPSIVRGDSTLGAPVTKVNHVVTDPPYPGLHTYKDLSIPYALMAAIAGYKWGLDWEEIDTRDFHVYKELLSRAIAVTARILEPGGYMVLFLSAHRLEYLEVLADTILSPLHNGMGLRRIYPVLGEAPGRLGRGMNKLVFVAVYKKNGDNLEDALAPLEWVEKVLDIPQLGRDEKDYSMRVAVTLYKILEPLYLGGLGKYL